MRIYLVQDSNGTGGGMRLFLAGENNKHKIINEMQIHPYILESFYAIEKNKLAILRALVKGGSVLFCDEMFSALDNKNKNLLSLFLLRKPELTVISITHDISEEALSYYDEVIIMEEGTIVFKGTLEDMKTRKIK